MMVRVMTYFSSNWVPCLIIKSLVVPLEQVVLDLDETLVCAYETSGLPAALRTRAVEAGLTCFELECVCSEVNLDLSLSLSYFEFLL
ncbi:hypothetical protein ACSBR2_025156 [Camellia fascicularis]